MMEGTDNKLIVWASSSNDELSQRCRMNHSFIYSLGRQIGDLLSIIPEGSSTAYICVLWPLHNSENLNIIEVDSSVTSNCSYNTNATYSHNLHSAISVLEYFVAKTVTVLVTVTSIDTFLKWNKKKMELAYFVKKILHQFYIVEDCTVNCVKHPLAKLCGIYNIIIETLDCSDAGIITNETSLNIKNLVSKELFYQKQSKEICIGGLKKELEKLKTIIFTPIHNKNICTPKCILIIGPSGVGKTTLVKKTAYDSDAHLLMLSAVNIASSDRSNNERMLRHTWNQATMLSEEGPCILLISEIETICSKREQDSVQSNTGMIAQLSMLMDDTSNGGNLLVLGETAKPDNIDPAIRRRFEQEIVIGVPDCFQRQEIIMSVTRSLGIHNVNFRLLAERTPGYVGADLTLLYHEASLYNLRTKGSISFPQSISMEDFEVAFDIVKASTQKDCIWHMKVKPVQWNEIGGMDNIKQVMKQHIEWPLLHSKQFRKMGLPHPRGVLLQGPPGCCKTTLVQAAATSCNATFFAVSAAQIFSPYVGDSEKAIVELFHKARLGAPAIIFFDEIDTLVGKRGFGVRGGIHEKVLSTLLNEMDGIGGKLYQSTSVMLLGNTERIEMEIPNIIVVAATNRLDLVDEAVLRPGRFNVIIDVPPPDEKLRESILRVFASSMPVECVDFKEFASKTNGFSGADIKNLCHEAALQAICENRFKKCSVTLENFRTALYKIQSSLDPKQLELYEFVSKKHKD